VRIRSSQAALVTTNITNCRWVLKWTVSCGEFQAAVGSVNRRREPTDRDGWGPNVILPRCLYSDAGASLNNSRTLVSRMSVGYCRSNSPLRILLR
jgi:hypothetical protein